MDLGEWGSRENEFLPERLALTKRIRLQREADAADLDETALVAPGIALGNVENQIAIRLHPGIERNVPIAERHRTRGISTRRVPYDVVSVGGCHNPTSCPGR